MLKGSLYQISGIFPKKTYISEPISGSVPKFGNEGTGTNYYHKSSSDIALLCNAQGFPYPEFRFVQF